MVFGFGPAQGTMFLTVWCDDRAEYERIVSLGSHLFDGQKAVVDLRGSFPERLFIRFSLERPFRLPMTRLHFENHEDAERIARTGVYSFDGQLWNATLLEPGVLGLDRLFPTEPPPQYHGRTWLQSEAPAEVQA